MKKLRFLLLLLSPFLWAFSCDDDASNDTPSGTWRMVNVSGGPDAVNHEIEGGLITWKFTFGSEGHKLTVVNNNTDDEIEDFFETGEYVYTYPDNNIPNTCEHKLQFEDINLGCQRISNIGVLTFTQLTPDGYIITLHKNEP
ncbi:MAG: hypothetical protein ACO1N9_01515 [Flavobacterium sp.]